MPKYSIIIAIYNRPEELLELLNSLKQSTQKNFEVLVIEDGSTEKCEHIVKEFEQELPVKYFFKENTGQGFSRNFGATKAEGEYLIFFDSDCLIPDFYFEEVEKRANTKDLTFWGGPDAAHKSFSPLQKAISFTMTSVLTTGGIRGNKSHAGKWQPRSFNMGIKKEIFLENKGFYQTNLGEDIELSTRLFNKGIKADLIEKAVVYHKRRNTLKSFFKQTYSFGAGRIKTGMRNKGGIKLVHWFPTLFSLGLLILPFLFEESKQLTYLGLSFYSLYFILMFFLATVKEKSLWVGILSCITGLVQMFGYGSGFLFTYLDYVLPCGSKGCEV